MTAFGLSSKLNHFSRFRVLKKLPKINMFLFGEEKSLFALRMRSQFSNITVSLRTNVAGFLLGFGNFLRGNIFSPPIASTLYSIHARTVSGKPILNPHRIHY